MEIQEINEKRGQAQGLVPVILPLGELRQDGCEFGVCLGAIAWAMGSDLVLEKRKKGREGGKEGGREGWREREREGGRKGGKKEGRKFIS